MKRNPKMFQFVESGIRKKNCLWNPDSWALQSRIQFKKILNPANHWNPVLGNPESTAWNPEFKAVSVFPYMRGEFYFNFCIKHSFWSMKLKVQRHNLVVLVQWRIKGRGWEVPVPPLSQGLDDRPRPPPPSLIWRSGSATVVVYITSLLTIQVSLLSEPTFVRENVTYDLVFLYLLLYFSHDLSGTFSYSDDFQMLIFSDSIILLVFVKQFSQCCNIERMKIIYLLFWRILDSVDFQRSTNWN